MILSTYSCREYHYTGYYDEELYNLVKPKLPVYRNYFDSSLECLPVDYFWLPNVCFLGLQVGFIFKLAFFSKKYSGLAKMEASN
mmetsp:Transcript_20812/g.32114  ORF Transcript_20812/g.32114 Transcript_20812/m.32114 type:complete len:84 (-) Transcript_20812:574-825(-)